MSTFIEYNYRLARALRLFPIPNPPLRNELIFRAFADFKRVYSGSDPKWADKANIKKSENNFLKKKKKKKT